METTNLAGRAGRWSAAHWKTAAFGWIAFAVARRRRRRRRRREADEALGDRERRVAPRRADPRPGRTSSIPARESVLVQSRTGDGRRAGVRRRRWRSVVADALAAAERRRTSSRRSTSRTPGSSRADRHSALVQFDVKGKAEDAKDKIAPILAAVDGVQAGNPSVIIEEFGQASADHQLDQRFERDMGRAELTSLPLTIAILRRRVRRARRGGAAGAARVLGRARRHRAQQPRQPRRADRPADAQRDHPDDRHGGRDRLLALLPAARARGATTRAARRTTRCSAPRARPARRC